MHFFLQQTPLQSVQKSKTYIYFIVEIECLRYAQFFLSWKLKLFHITELNLVWMSRQSGNKGKTVLFIGGFTTCYLALSS